MPAHCQVLCSGEPEFEPLPPSLDPVRARISFPAFQDTHTGDSMVLSGLEHVLAGGHGLATWFAQYRDMAHDPAH